MKRKLVSLTSLFCALLLFLTGCGSEMATERISEYLQANARYTPTASSVERGDTATSLIATTYQDALGPYVYLTDTSTSTENAKHLVFNLETRSTVLFFTEPDHTDYEITLCETLEGDCFFSLTETVDKTKKTYLYDTNGKSFAEAEGDVTPDFSCDILRFNGKCYLTGENGAFAYAYDYADIMALPEFDYYNDTYYYRLYANSFCVYNKNLTFVSSYTVPAGSYATGAIVMPDGNVLIQNMNSLPEDTKDYDLVFNDSYSYPAKYDVQTLIINVKDGEAKEIELDYLLYSDEPQYMDEEMAAETGLKKDSVHALVGAYAIENKHVRYTSSPNAMLIMDKKGTLSCLDKINGETITDISLIADGRFLVTGTSNSFVISSKGAVLGIFGEVTQFGDKFLANNKVYSSDFSLLFDIAKSGYTPVNVVGNGLLLQDADGNLAMYRDGAQPVTVCRVSSGKRHVYTGENYIVTEDTRDGLYYDFYNDKGQNVLTVSPGQYTKGQPFSSNVSIHYTYGGVTLLSAMGNDGLSTFYILH